MSKKQRNSTVELLRIIAMLCIIVSHYTVHGVLDVNTLQGVNKYILQNTVLGNLGVDIFVMISGYFGVHAAFSKKKVVKLWSQVWTYSIILYVFALCMGTAFSSWGVIQAACPVIFREYWFFTAYMVLFLFTPYINKLLHNITKRDTEKLIVMMIVMWSIIPLIPYGNVYGAELAQFLMFYCIGAYIRLYPESKINNKKLAVIGLFVCAAVLWGGSCVILTYFPQKGNAYLFARTSLVIIGIAAFLLIILINMKPTYNVLVNRVAGAMFGVYLIHDNPYVREFLWKRVFVVEDFIHSRYLIVHMMISVVAVWVICTIIDIVKTKVIDKPVHALINKVF